MDVCLVIKQRLEELGFEQRDLSAAAEVTESYISQLLTRKKLPPASGRTDIYDKMGKFLKLPGAELSKLADHQRKEELKRTLGDAPPPLFKEVRELVLRKCAPDKEKQFRVIFEKHPFGEVERLVIQKLLDVGKRVAKEELESENWVHQVARLTGRSYDVVPPRTHERASSHRMLGEIALACGQKSNALLHFKAALGDDPKIGVAALAKHLEKEVESGKSAPTSDPA